MKKIISLFIFSLVLFSSIGLISACGYHDHGDCSIEKTIVEGKVYFEDTNSLAGNADVTITCYHDGNTYTKTTKTAIYGFLKGTYFVEFSQSQCVAGDEVTVTAYKSGMGGANEGEIIDFITTKCLDIDIGIINVPLVPEFGIIICGLTIFSAVGIFFFVRRE